MSDLKFGRVSFYNPETKKGVIEVDDGGEQEFDASAKKEVEERIQQAIGGAEDWQTLELLRKKRIEVSFRPGDAQEVADKLKFFE